MKFRRLFYIAVLAAALSAAAFADDWPQWRGPDRTGLSKETGLLKSWPSGGPSRVWMNSSLGPGYGSVAVRGDRIFVQSLIGRQSTVASLNIADGKMLWSRILGPGRDDDRGPGPRGTPTLDGDRLYALSENGDLSCLRVADGSIVWQKNILKDFQGYNISWLIS